MPTKYRLLSSAGHPWHRVMRAFLAMPNVEMKSKAKWGLKLLGLGNMLDLYDNVKKTAPPTRSTNSARKASASTLLGQEPMALSKFTSAEASLFADIEKSVD